MFATISLSLSLPPSLSLSPSPSPLLPSPPSLSLSAPASLRHPLTIPRPCPRSSRGDPEPSVHPHPSLAQLPGCPLAILVCALSARSASGAVDPLEGHSLVAAAWLCSTGRLRRGPPPRRRACNSEGPTGECRFIRGRTGGLAYQRAARGGKPWAARGVIRGLARQNLQKYERKYRF